jgi:glycosyltransferase involved in cell wall biosynthesis
MNIWIVSAYDPLPIIDADIRLLRYGSIARALEADGHQVVFWTSTFAHWRKKSRFTQDTTYEVSPNFIAKFLHANSYSSNVSLARIRHNVQLARAFNRQASQAPDRPDIVLAEIPCLELAEAAANFASRHCIPFICDIQDIWPDVYLTCLPRSLHTLGRWVLASEYARLRRVLSCALGVTAVSEAYLRWSQTWLNRQLGENDQIFPLGYALPPEAIRLKAGRRRRSFLDQHRLGFDKLLVTFLGQFATSYDVETIVEAARILEKNAALPPYQVVLAGTGDKEPALRRRAVGLSTVTFTGWLEHTDTICLLESSDLALAAYARNAAQSLPFKPFEYMAFGLPIINSLPGELAEIITRQGLGLNYEAESAASLATAISRLLLDAELRASCAQQAQLLYAKSYSSDAIYGQMSHYLYKRSIRHSKLSQNAAPSIIKLTDS